MWLDVGGYGYTDRSRRFGLLRFEGAWYNGDEPVQLEKPSEGEDSMEAPASSACILKFPKPLKIFGSTTILS